MILLLSALPILLSAQPAGTELAYVKNDEIYVVRCSQTGIPNIGAKPVAVCRVPKEFLPGVWVDWTSDGQIEFGGDADDDQFTPSVWIVDVRAHSKAHKVWNGRRGSLSPDRKHLLVTRDWTGAHSLSHTDLYLIDLATKRKTLIANNVDPAVEWSPKGDSFVYTKQEFSHGEFSGNAQIMLEIYPGLKAQPVGQMVMMQSCDGYSPDGRYVSSTNGPLEYRATPFYRLSPPFVESSFDVDSHPDKNGEATYLSAWAPDSRHVLLSISRFDDYDRESWNSLAIGDTGNWKGSFLPHTGEFRDAAFGIDWHHVLALDHSHPRRGGYRLVAFDTARPWHVSKIADGVRCFAFKR